MFNKLRFYLIDSQIFISLAAVFLFWAGYIIVANQLTIPGLHYFSLIFLSTFGIYNIKSLDSKLRFKRPIGLLLIVALLINTIFLNYNEIIFLAHLGVISLLYNSPFSFTVNRWLPFRTIPLVKIILIAYVWISMAVIFPAIILRKEILSGDVFIKFFGLFCYISAITLPFDIRDYYHDREHRVLTVPGIIGMQATRFLAVLLLLTFCYMFIKADFHLLLISGFCLASVLLVIFSNEKRPGFYFTIFIDGLIILFFVLVAVQFYYFNPLNWVN